MMAALDQMTAGVELTPKGIAYAEGYGKSAMVADIDPALDFRDWRASIEAEIDRLIGILDEFDGDTDLEPTLGSPTSDPGWMDAGSQTFWAAGSTDDGEAEDVNEDGGDILDEPHDGALDQCEGDTREDAEYSLGWLTYGSQEGGNLAVGYYHGDMEGDDVQDAPHDANTSEDCELDPGDSPFFPNGSHLFGGGSLI